mmetsp:Transcript_80693/g.261538  ORF Transcript_80693/g.261538 Transcript_80693/m.261538 type:complete len:345 (-) Transcript_80693:181-1215(-)
MIKGTRRCLPTLDVPVPELRIGGQSRRDMSRHVNLRHHLDVALLRVRHDVTNLLLGVGLPAAEALRTDLRELRVAVHWQPPTLVVGEVPMEAVELEGGHGVKQELHLLRPEEVPAHVELETTPLEARRILDQHLRQLLSVRARLHQLPQGLHAVEEAGERGCRQLNIMLPDLQNVALGRLRLVKHDLKMHAATNTCGTPGAVRPHLPLPLKSLPQRRQRQVVFRDALPDLHLDAALEAEWRRLRRKVHERRVRYQRQSHFMHCLERPAGSLQVYSLVVLVVAVVSVASSSHQIDSLALLRDVRHARGRRIYPAVATFGALPELGVQRVTRASEDRAGDRAHLQR